MMNNPQDFPSEERIDIIGSNGNDGLHYDAKYLIKCYNKQNDLMLTTNSMTSAHEWLERNDGHFTVEMVDDKYTINCDAGNLKGER